MKTHAPIALIALLLSACTDTAGLPLPSSAQEHLTEVGSNPAPQGELMYHGHVQERDEASADLFHYERWVAPNDQGFVGTHVTFTPDDTPIVLHSALYADDGELISFEEIHGQTGLVGTVTVLPDGQVELDVSIGDDVFHRTEKAGDPVHVGPTLFGFALQNWDALMAGEKQYLRFVVLSDHRTYRFALSLESTDTETTAFKMTATSPFVRMAVSAMRITFDTASREPIRFEGLVPPMIGNASDLHQLDARVDYELVAEDYR
jgi:hypothetical protein